MTTLTRLVARVRDRAAQRLWQQLARLPTAVQRAHLEQLLVSPEGARSTPLDHLRRAPPRLSAPGLVQALRRLTDVRRLEVNRLDLTHLPPGRGKALARYAAAARAQALARMPEERRIATLLAFAHVFEATAQDDALDLLDHLISTLLARAERSGQQYRLRTLKDLDAAALRLQEACAVLLDPTCPDAAVRATVFARMSPEQLAAASTRVATLARPPDEHYYAELAERYRQIRRFLPTLLKPITFHGTPAGQPVLEALAFLARLEEPKPPKLHTAPTRVVKPAWRRLVLESDEVIDRRYYTFCVLARLQESLQRRDLFVTPSERWHDPRASLLHGAAWDVVRPQVCRTLGHARTPETELEALGRQVDDAYRRTAANLPTNTAVRLERDGNHPTLTLSGLDKLDEPPSLEALRAQVERRLPRLDLPEILLEVQSHTGFASEFTHISEGHARVDNLAVSICAVLLAEACNIGLEPLVRPDVPALTRGRLAWVQQNYIRAATLIRANARLVDAQAGIPLARMWGGGEVASADGLRFVVPVRTINAGPNRKYFHIARGVTYYNFTSDQFTGFHSIVIPGTLRDSLFVLEGLLEHQTSLQPTEVMADSAAYSDVIFGLFWLLEYQFSPRLADIGDARFWRMDRTADYGPLNSVARHRVNTALIARHWDDLLRVAGSLKMGKVSAAALMRSLQTSSRPFTLARAIGELGRIAKTLYLLAYIDDESYRRRILMQLNRGEGRHRVARAVFHGQRGELRQHYREGQEDQLGALGLVLNVVVLWNTLYMDAALQQVQREGRAVQAADVERLSPLRPKHINLLGRYYFPVMEMSPGQLRPLRNPEDADV